MESRLEQHRRLFMEAPQRLEEARRSNEQAQQIIRELAAAANIPIPEAAQNLPDPDSILEHVEGQGDTAAPVAAEHVPPLAPPNLSSAGRGRARIRAMRQQIRSGIPTLRTNVRNNIQNMQTRFSSLRQRLAERQPFQNRFRRLAEEEEENE